MEDDDTLLTTQQLAMRRGCSSSKIEKERLTGGGVPFVRDGVSVRYRLGDFRSWLAAQRRFNSTSEAA